MDIWIIAFTRQISHRKNVNLEHLLSSGIGGLMTRTNSHVALIRFIRTIPDFWQNRTANFSQWLTDRDFEIGRMMQEWIVKSFSV
jgi:hypothetical protein